ncbi:plasmid replication, integration and excision activator [Nonomuraea endophytica]|uniref:plasmid replication, integration and excision activator n=1 Tax=Nonomuraea endophytica TaxID=714136 RepID=UPI0037C88E83
MSLRDPIPVHHQTVFPHGCYVVGPVTPVLDFEAGTKDNPVRKIDTFTGEPMWAVPVMDANPEARTSDKTVSVKLLGAAEPVVPPVPPQLKALGVNLVPVEFDGLMVRAYVSDRGRLEWSVKARVMRAAGSVPEGAGGQDARAGGHARGGGSA